MADCKGFAPLKIYDQTKLENVHTVSSAMGKYSIVRIAWAVGLYGRNFIKTLLSVGRKYDTVRIVNDQIGAPTYTLDSARLLADTILTEKYGYYYVANEGDYVSWYDFIYKLFRQVGCTTAMVPATTAEYGLSKAIRSFNSRLDKAQVIESGFRPLPTWWDALGRYLELIKKLNECNSPAEA